ncbi:MAG: hypothetical protein QOJ59_4392, partial [Thermomicrobiales bacterium]|nr:hypothetical protein [Thermomicrobiales bacterium]
MGRGRAASGGTVGPRLSAGAPPAVVIRSVAVLILFPGAEGRKQILTSDRGEVVFAEMTDGDDCAAHLLQVAAATDAAVEMALE